MDLVKKIADKLGITAVPEVSDSTGLHLMFDDGGIECSTGIFVFGLVHLLKPKRILETGLYSAISTIFMGLALEENGLGHIDTLEIEQSHINRSKERLQKMGLTNYVTIHNQPSLDFKPEGIYDLLFLDSEPQIRFAEVAKFYPYLKEGGYILIHDLAGHLGQALHTNPDHPTEKFWPWGPLNQELVQYLIEDKLRVVPLPAPRGMVMLYKTTETDYRVR